MMRLTTAAIALLAVSAILAFGVPHAGATKNYDSSRSNTSQKVGGPGNKSPKIAIKEEGVARKAAPVPGSATVKPVAEEAAATARAASAPAAAPGQADPKARRTPTTTSIKDAILKSNASPLKGSATR